MVVLPVLASALHLDPVLNQVLGADEALGDLVHLGDPDFLYPDLDPQNRIAHRQSPGESQRTIPKTRLQEPLGSGIC